MNSIVVGVDESTASAGALRWAVAEGLVRNRPVRAVLCWSFLDQHRGPGAGAEFDPTYGAADADRALAAIVEHALGTDAATVEQVTVNDHPGPGLVGQVAAEDLLVVGARGLGAVRAAVLGSVSSYCLHHAAGPVAVLRPDVSTRPEHDRVVVGIDESEDAAHALRWAATEARSRRASLQVVHAWSLPAVAAYVVDSAPIAAAAGELVEAALAEAGLADDARIEARVVPGAPAAALLEAAQRADLVVVGSRGHGGFTGLLVGSVSHQVAGHAPCAVVVVPCGR